jgi:flavin reductase (DIM6/NTAB) family NADH-FMN oxidoreductase RutF
MEKINIGSNTFIYPMSVTLLGSIVDGKPNFMPLGWVSRVNANPPMIAVGVNKKHYTNEAIRKNKSFSVNFPDVDMVKVTDYCGLVSGKKIDKSELFEVFFGDLDATPMIKECTLSMECKLVDIYEMPSNDLFIGEIKGVYTEKRYLTDGKLDIKKMNPLLLTMPDNSYWMVGDYVGKAWNIGRKFRE